MNTENGIEKLKGLLNQNESFEENIEFEATMLSLAFLNSIERNADLLGLKRKDLAELIGTSPSYITQIFKGIKVPNLKTLTALGLAVNKKFDVKAVDSIQESRKEFDDYDLGYKFDSSKIRKMEVCHRKFDFTHAGMKKII